MHVKRHSETNEPISVLGAVRMDSKWMRESNFVRYANSRYVANRSTRSVGGSLCNLPPNYFGGANISIPREQLLRVGLFDEKVGRGQDVELGYRLWKAGIRLVYEQRALLLHYCPEMRSMQEWLSKFSKAYRYSIPLLNELHPEFVEQFGHWFLEQPVFRHESFKRTIIKWLIRLFIHKKLAKPMQIFLELTDHRPLFYAPFMYKYVITSACLDSVNQRK
jgi:GT2 family glycosyltransferase